MKEKLQNALRCLIVDDETSAHAALKAHIDRVPWLVFEDSCRNVVTALSIIAASRPDVIFLDIDMPGLSGIELLRIMGKNDAVVVITSAHARFALDGFDYQVRDFLLKPIAFTRFLQTANKLMPEHKNQLTDNINLKSGHAAVPFDKPGPFAFVSERNPQENLSDANGHVFGERSMWARIEKRMLIIEYSKIYMMEACGNYVKIILDDKQHMVRSSLTYMIQHLPSYFTLTHKSHVINLNLVSGLEGNQILMKHAEHRVPISAERKNEVLKKLRSYYG